MLLGYMITIVVLSSFALLIAFMIKSRKTLASALSEGISRYSLIGLAVILVFFAMFAVLLVHPVEQLYFDENIYQGIALNIMHSGNALWCEYGTGYLGSCFVNRLYHDIVGYDVFIAMAFAIFGPSVQTAYALELLVGVLSVLGVFLLSSVLTRRKEVPVLSALVFSMIPELFIWSRTQAAPDMPFMMLTIFSAFFFTVFAKRPKNGTFAMFAMSLVLVLYTRTEGMILVPLYVILYFFLGSQGIRENAREKLTLLKKALSEPMPLVIVLVFVLMLLPALYYSVTELKNPSYGNSSSQALFSLSNFKQNFPVNLQFITATSDTVYPEISEANLTPLALAGVVTLALYARKRNRFGVIVSIGALALSYFLFYPFFYAGSYGYGVDVRFVLQTLPFLAVFAGFGLFGIGNAITYVLAGRFKSHEAATRCAVYAVLVAALVIYPFTAYAPKITLPVSQMPQESYPSSATSFFYNNYNAVPANCLVFSFTPDLWYQYGRSAAQIGYLTGGNQTLRQSFENYSCYVLDYGYWCTVPPYQGTTCKSDISQYNLSVIASSGNSTGGFAFFRLLNYSP